MKNKQLPSFFADFPKERIKELMEKDKPKDFNKVMDKLLHADAKKHGKRKR